MRDNEELRHVTKFSNWLMPQLSRTHNSTTETSKPRGVMKCVIYMTPNMCDLVFTAMFVQNVTDLSTLVRQLQRLNARANKRFRADAEY